MEHEKLKTLLQSWKPNVDLPADFQRHVWQSISAREEETSGWRALGEWIQRLISQPKWAIIVLTIVIGMTGLMGLAQASSIKESTMETRYVTSIDPYAKSITHTAK